jgi:hypothetical protein
VIALVDYDNVPELERNRGPVHVIERIVDSLGAAVANENEIRFRLYGGWFQGVNLSRRAQRLAPTIQTGFPRMITPAAAGTPIRVRAELALSLESTPGRYLTHTYRDRALPDNVRCSPLPFRGCAAPAACPLAPLEALLRDGQCPENTCAVAVGAILTKPEQKLVDTMLTVDVMHLARLGTDRLVVVSTDDDMWPGIQGALLSGADVVHVHPVAGRTTPAHYAALAGLGTGQYSQCSF